MRSRHAGIERACRELRALSGVGLDLPGLVAVTGQIVARLVPYDGACWHELDPGPLIETSAHLENMTPTGACASEIEYLRDDFSKFASLARRDRPTAVLSVATAGRPARSVRYQRIIRPAGFHGELRAAFVGEAGCWGSVGLFREAPSDFRPEEAEVLAALAAELGRAFRGAALGSAHRTAALPAAPGLLVLDADRRLRLQTAIADAWLEQLGWSRAAAEDLPYAVYTVADTARRRRATATARVRAGGGGWVLLHASMASGDRPGDVAVILEGSKPSAIVPLLARAYALSRRERDVTGLVLEGHDTQEIAERLVISPHTVQQHLKLVFGKVGVRSRRELVARVFAGHDPPPMEDRP
jgi:DNA-binding CsgD family transcriptional regulator